MDDMLKQKPWLIARVDISFLHNISTRANTIPTVFQVLPFGDYDRGGI